VIERQILTVVECLHNKGCIDGHDACFRGRRKSLSSCERGNRVILHDPHLDVIAIDARQFMLFGD
jgi:hypothetical protein